MAKVNVTRKSTTAAHRPTKTKRRTKSAQELYCEYALVKVRGGVEVRMVWRTAQGVLFAVQNKSEMLFDASEHYMRQTVSRIFCAVSKPAIDITGVRQVALGEI